MKQTWTICGSLIFMMAVILSCGDDNPLKPQDPFPKIVKVSVPAQIWTATEAHVIVSATVSDAQGLTDIDSVFITVLKPDSTTVALHNVLNDSAAQGDLIALDGVYSRQISTSFTQGQGGQYYFVFQALDSDGHLSDKVVEPVPALLGSKNEPPTISDITLPEIISVDPSIEFLFKVYAEDPQGIIDLLFVIFRIHHWENPAVTHMDTIYDDGMDLDAAKEDGIFTGTFTPAFADSVVGFYPFSFQAFDREGDSTDLVRRDVEVIIEDNWPPTIFNLSVPDTFDSGSPINNFLITIEVVDPQGLSDVDSVYFTSRKPDGTMANQGRPILLVDDGDEQNYGDIVPGDGIYSFKAIFDPSAQKGDYTWTFAAVDRSGARSNIIVHILTII